MIKNVVKKHYGLVDPENRVELEEALAALETVKSEEGTQAVEEKQIEHGAALLEDGTTMIFFPGDVFTDGSTVFTDPEGTLPADDGEYVLQNGDIIVVSDGIGILTPAVADEEMPEEAPAGAGEEPVAQSAEGSGNPTSVKETTTTTTERSFSEVDAKLFFEQIDSLASRVESLEGTKVELEEENAKLKEDNVKLSEVPASKKYTEQVKGTSDFHKQKLNMTTRAKLGLK